MLDDTRIKRVEELLRDGRRQFPRDMVEPLVEKVHWYQARSANYLDTIVTIVEARQKQLDSDDPGLIAVVVDKALLEAVQAILDGQDISVTDAITLFCEKVVEEQGIPFPLKLN